MTGVFQFLIEGVSALYIGHSLVSPVLPEMMHDLLDAPVEMQIINGAPLQMQWTEGAHAQGVNARTWLPDHPIGTLVMTERVPVGPTIEYHDSAGYAEKWLDLARQGNPQVQSWLYQTWDDMDPGSTEPWRARILADLPKWQQILDQVNSDLPPGAQPMRMLPVGLGMVRLHDAAAAGEVPGAQSIRDFFVDSIHPSPAGGFYYIAMINYAALTGKDPTGLPRQLSGLYGPYPKVPKDQAAVLQRLAWETVQAYPKAD